MRHILGRRLETSRVKAWAYSSASSHLLSAIVADATGQSTLAFAKAKLAEPLGIAADDALELAGPPWPLTPAEWGPHERAPVQAWPRDPQGYHVGGVGLRPYARDLAKLGYLYLNGGHWDGTQVVPAEYVAASTRPPGRPSRGPGDYGYQWWVTNETGHDSFRAMGFGGQVIQTIPELDLVVVITGDPDQGRHDGPNLGPDDDRPSHYRLAPPGRLVARRSTSPGVGGAGERPRPAGAAARRAERPTRVTGTIRPDPGSRWSPRSRQPPLGRLSCRRRRRGGRP